MPVKQNKKRLGAKFSLTSLTCLMGLVMGFFCLVALIPGTNAADLPNASDADSDGLTDQDEMTRYHTDPGLTDTDGDGYDDGTEIANGYSPLHGDGKRLVDVDSDSDYLIDAWELVAGTDLMNPDSDGDLYLDGTEVAASYDPLNPAPIQLAKRIQVDLKTQKLAYYFDERLFDEFLISGGLPATPTPVGEFSVLNKIPVKHYGGVGFDFPNTLYNLFFTNRGRWNWNYYIHGAYWHDNWGQPMSHGCINVAYDPMERLYWWAQIGTPVKIEA